MFGKSEKIYNIYEKPEATDPADRMVYVREGFNLWAFIFDAVWLIYRRQWWVLLAYMVLAIAMAMLLHFTHASEGMTLVVQLAIKTFLGFHANDLQGWTLKRRGYRMAGVLVAESDMRVQHRYYEHAS